MLDLGDAVPDLKLPSSKGGDRSLQDYKGKRIVLYFYPKDDTPGCTKEACNFRDGSKAYEALGAVVVGVSKDSMKSHDQFIKKHELPFELLSDEDLKLAEAFGVWKEKSMYGRSFMGVERSTFLIDENGTIKKAWRKVKVGGHHEEVLEALRSMQ